MHYFNYKYNMSFSDSDEDMNEEELIKECEAMQPDDTIPSYQILNIIDEKTKIIKINFIELIIEKKIR